MKAGRRKQFSDYMRGHWQYYAMLLLPIIYYAVFRYRPIAGLTVAFKDYNMFLGAAASKWVGLKNFKAVFAMSDFYRALKNTLVINVIGTIVCFPAPILLALFLNEIQNERFKRITQNILYLPHFISWVIIGGMAYQVFSSSTGLMNAAIRALTGSTIPFLTDAGWWLVTYFLISLWRSTGWGAIVYLSAITGIDPAIYEAAKVDGASRFRTMFSITLPNILGTIVIMLILNIGSLMYIGFEQPLTLQNSAVMQNADVLSTYVYRVGTQNARYSIATAVGLFQSVINFILLLSANSISKKLTGNAIW
ncbi:MAG: ABC transporter permease [Christensenellales bacterium]|jgi:putative aldouronate transport system permease protein